MAWQGVGGGRILDVLALWIAEMMHFSICALGWTRERGLRVLRKRGTPQGIHCPLLLMCHVTLFTWPFIPRILGSSLTLFL